MLKNRSPLPRSISFGSRPAATFLSAPQPSPTSISVSNSTPSSETHSTRELLLFLLIFGGSTLFLVFLVMLLYRCYKNRESERIIIFIDLDESNPIKERGAFKASLTGISDDDDVGGSSQENSSEDESTLLPLSQHDVTSSATKSDNDDVDDSSWENGSETEIIEDASTLLPSPQHAVIPPASQKAKSENQICLTFNSETGVVLDDRNREIILYMPAVPGEPVAAHEFYKIVSVREQLESASSKKLCALTISKINSSDADSEKTVFSLSPHSKATISNSSQTSHNLSISGISPISSPSGVKRRLNFFSSPADFSFFSYSANYGTIKPSLDSPQNTGNSSDLVLSPSCSQHTGNSSDLVLSPSCSQHTGNSSDLVLSPSCSQHTGDSSSFLSKPFIVEVEMTSQLTPSSERNTMMDIDTSISPRLHPPGK